jgi:predicted DNA-binding transcriptional regulator YafY
MQIQRLFETVYLLLNHKQMTARQLAERFEVSVRTIFRDLETLSLAGIPIYTTQGKGGGICLLDNFVLNKAVISNEEQNQILFALQSVTGTGQLEAENILLKLRGLFDKQTTDWIKVDFTRWGYRSTDSIKFEILKTAIINKLTLQFNYFSTIGESTQRKAYPLRLVFKGKSWYLQAYCLLKDDYRTFKINRICQVESLNDKELNDNFQTNTFIPPEISTTDPPPTTFCQLSLLFQPQAAFRVFDDFKDTDISKNPDGTLLVKAKMPDDEGLAGYLLSFGTWLTILEPSNIRQRVSDLIWQIAQRYST